MLYEISRKGLGMTCVVDADDTLLGIITDGDLRRKMADLGSAVLERTAGEVMTHHPITVTRKMLAAEALKVLEGRKITALVVADEARHVDGVIHLHHLWRTELV